jgi:hypothetical protein
MVQVLEKIISEFSYKEIFAITFLYFLFLYFIVGHLFQFICNFLYRKSLFMRKVHHIIIVLGMR